MIGWVRRFGEFWYDFVVGDDWRVAVAVVVAIAVTVLLAHVVSIVAWWVLPAAVIVALPLSLLRAVRR